MKRLVLLGEGHGEAGALPVLTHKLLREKEASQSLFVDGNLIRTGGVSGLVKWDREKKQTDYSRWRDRIRLAALRPNLGCVLAVFDGDEPGFPAGSGSRFCAATAAKALALEAGTVGAGRTFSLAVVFACAEYETWIIAGVESLAGKRFEDGRLALPPGLKFPEGDPESHGKRWLERHYPDYRQVRDQAALTRMLDLQVVRSKQLRSFRRLEHAIEQLLEAIQKGDHISSPG